MVDRKEIGAPGDFAALETEEGVLALVQEELGEQAAALLIAVLDKPRHRGRADLRAAMGRTGQARQVI